MANDLPNLDKIEDYLNGLMPEEERKGFEEQLAEDPALKKELDLVQDMLAGIEQFGDDALKARIGAAQQELESEGFFEKKTGNVIALPTRRRQFSRQWAAAASLLIICGAALFLWLKRSNPYQELFAKNFQAEDSKTAILIDDLSASGLFATEKERRSSLADALKSYQAKDYEDAQKTLASYHEMYPQDTIAQFYLGLSELHLFNFDKAITLLRPIALDVLPPGQNSGQVSRGIDFQNEITWYLALAYSKWPGQAAKDSTLLLLRRLESAGDSLYAAKARTALRQLE